MSAPPPGGIAQRGAAAERGRLVRPPQRLLDKLQPFDFSEANMGLRRADVVAFSAVAATTDTIILLRATNPSSLPYIGVLGFTPKPIDCKAKTAKADDWVDGHAVECAGLVVDPHCLSPKVFAGNQDKATECWQQFLRDQHRVKVKNGVDVFVRGAGKGFYAVDTARPSTTRRRHGCLMLSSQDLPKDFDPAASHTRAWMQRHMRYVHGDYDLYGIVDASAIDRKRGVNVQYVQHETFFDIENLFTHSTHDVQLKLNAAIGCDMVQHGEQVAYKFSADKIYVFAPDGGKWVVRQGVSDKEMPGMLSDLFRYVFGTEIKR
jgi:hypothetical protein